MTTLSPDTEDSSQDAAAEHCRLGAAHIEHERFVEAEAEYRKAIALSPDHAEAHFKLGNIQKRRSLLAAAEASYRRAIAIAPAYAKALYNLGNTLKQQSRLSEAEGSYRRAIEVQPDYIDAHINLGVILVEQDRFSEAEVSYRHALEISADDVPTLFNLGLALKAQGRSAEAQAAYRKVLKIRPGYADAAVNLANLLKSLDRLVDAESVYRRALEFAAANADLCYGLACILIEQDRDSEARFHFRQALTIRPDHIDAASSLLFLSSYAGDESPSAQLEAAKAYGRLADAKVKSRYSSWLCPPQAQCLRVGLVSGDLRNHPVGFFLEGLLAHIDPAQVELFAYPTQAAEDELSRRLAGSCKAWKPIYDMNDAAAASMIHADAVHILLDLSGHTKHTRLPLFAWKAAPVQASWLGYCATTGIAAMDYYIADSWTLPKSEEIRFSEAVWRLPESYLCFAPVHPDLDVSSLPALANAHITFGSFNNLSKMGDAVVELWARVLSAVPGSRLFLKTAKLDSAATRQRTVEAFATQGIGADRLILEATIPDHTRHLAAYRRVDIALDTFPYNGVTTTAEALWMGVPVLTLAGESFLSRQGLGMLMNTGLSEWIGATPDDYLAKAVSHAANLEHLASLRTRLRRQVLASPAFDAPRFTRHFEDALWQMWRQAEDGYLTGIDTAD